MGTIRHSSYLPKETSRLVVIQPRDLEILDAVYQYSPMTTEHMVRLFSKDGTLQYDRIRHVRRRLLDKRLILVAKQQCLLYKKTWKKESHIHFLGDNAVPLLKEKFGYLMPKTHYDELPERRVNYDHDLAITDFHTRMHTSSKHHGLTYLKRKSFIESCLKPKVLAKHPFQAKRWKLTIFETKPRLIPDDIFGIFTNKKLCFFLEINRNTEPNISAFQRKTVQSTLDKYIEVFKQNLHTKAYGVDNFRVLFITTSEKQIDNLLAHIKFTPEIFYFSTLQAVRDSEDILTLPFRTNKGNLRTLI